MAPSPHGEPAPLPYPLALLYNVTSSMTGKTESSWAATKRQIARHGRIRHRMACPAHPMSSPLYLVQFGFIVFWLWIWFLYYLLSPPSSSRT